MRETRDAAKRDAAIAELFGEHPVMYEPDQVIEGRAAISQVAGALLERFGADFHFEPDSPVVGHHGLAALRWRAGPDGPASRGHGHQYRPDRRWPDHAALGAAQLAGMSGEGAPLRFPHASRQL